jgi:hypothetical protein
MDKFNVSDNYIKDLVSSTSKEFLRNLKDNSSFESVKTKFKNDFGITEQTQKNNRFQFTRGVGGTSQGKGVYLPYGFGELWDVFPQFLIYLTKTSGSLRTAIQIKSTLLFGNGFKDKALANLVVNKKGETANDLLRMVCKEFVTFNGFSIHSNFNGLGKVCSLKILPFENLRQSQPAENSNDYLVLINAYDKYQTRPQKPTTQVFDFFSTDVSENAKKVLCSKLNDTESDYNGQILYFYIKDVGTDYYPFPAYASVLEDCENESLIKTSKKRDIQLGFKSKIIITKFGTNNPTELQMAEDEAIFRQMIGENGSQAALLYAQNQESKPAIDVISNQDLSKIYEYAETTTQRNIFRTFGIPEEFYSFMGKSDFMGDSEKMKRLLDYVQKTQLIPMQNEIKARFEKIFSIWKEPHNFSFEIENLTPYE